MELNPGFTGCQNDGDCQLTETFQCLFCTLERVAVMVKQGTIKICENEQGESHFVLPVVAQLFVKAAIFLSFKSFTVT
jgi:hypothetical protein